MYLSNFKRRPLTHRKRRIRKKYRIGEFTEYGFELEAPFVGGISSEAAEAVMDGLFCLIMSRGLMFGGGIDRGNVLMLAIAPPRRCTTATLDDVSAIRDWLHAREEIASVKTGPLEDAWA